MIQLGAMPLPQFVQLHPDAKVTPEELATLKAYLAPWNPAPPAAAALASFTPVALDKIQPELNGVPFDPAFEDWKLISTTDRGDNHTFRFILGNEIAFQAAQSGNISPWPDGSRLAKVTWQQETAPNGLIQPGKFIQVELMEKDAAQYKKTEGWGWGRWRGLDLKPYGKDAQFVTECTTCHLPVRGNDYVYTLPITQAHAAQQEQVNNPAAALGASLPYQPLGWRPITLFVDPAPAPRPSSSATKPPQPPWRPTPQPIRPSTRPAQRPRSRHLGAARRPALVRSPHPRRAALRRVPPDRKSQPGQPHIAVSPARDSPKTTPRPASPRSAQLSSIR
jgi:hypothetical protein